jgi:hypothetical protein
MNIAQINMKDLDINFPNAKLAYTIIQSLLSHNEAVHDLLALMSHALDQDVAKALTNTNEWQNYIDSKRNLENTNIMIEKFTEELFKLNSK